jgi:hypothetical protein
MAMHLATTPVIVTTIQNFKKKKTDKQTQHEGEGRSSSGTFLLYILKHLSALSAGLAQTNGMPPLICL